MLYTPLARLRIREAVVHENIDYFVRFQVTTVTAERTEVACSVVHDPF